jgi:hypothetical protein
MLIKVIKQNLNKFHKHIKYYQMIKLDNSMTQQEYSHKNFHKWDLKHLLEIIHMNSIKIYFMECHQNKDKNLRIKQGQELENI